MTRSPTVNNVTVKSGIGEMSQLVPVQRFPTTISKGGSEVFSHTGELANYALIAIV